MTPAAPERVSSDRRKRHKIVSRGAGQVVATTAVWLDRCPRGDWTCQFADFAPCKEDDIYRIKARRGPKKAIMAVAASILTAIYHMLKDGTMYKDLGRNHFDRRSTDQQKKRLVKRLADLGYAVEIKPLAA